MYPGTWAATSPDKPALIMAGTGRTTTYAELDDRSLRLAQHLRAAGLEVGDTVALISDNQPETLEVYWAALRSGLYVTAVNHQLSAAEASYVVRDCGAKALVVAVGKAETVAALDVEVPVRLAFGGPVGAEGGLAGFEGYDEALAAASSEPLPSQPHGEDLLYSSGTTGRPKGIKQPLPTYQVDEEGYPYVAIFGGLFGYGPDTVYLSPAPVYHAAPLRFMGVVQALGGTVVMMEKFDAEGFLAAVQRYAVSDTQVVPTMFVRLLKLEPEVRASYDVSSLRTVVHAAAPCPVEVKRRMIEWLGPVVHEYYASTEANGATYVPPEVWLRKPGTVGTPILGVPHVCGSDGVEVGANEVGTIYFEPTRGEPFTYHGDPERTAQSRHPAQPTWTTVGDLGYVDEDGFLFLTDRAAFMIISGGVNIYPQEVEDLYSLHPDVLDVAVIGVPDEEMGERVVAYVQPAAGVAGVADPAALGESLREFARERIARFKVPREVLLTDELRRTPTGKLVKGTLRERYATERAGAGS